MTSPVEVLRAAPVGCAFDVLPSPSVSRSSSARTALSALKRNDRLLSEGHPQEALAAVMRPLGRPPRDPDLLARLRIARGLALWQSGPPGPARVQVIKGWKRAAFDLTRARALEALARIATSDQDWDDARAALCEATALYRAAGHPGLSRTLQGQANVCRDAGEMDRALALQAEAVEVAREHGAADGLVESLTYRATLLTMAGRFAEARADLMGAWCEGVPAPVRARFHVAAAMLDLTQGDLSSARAALADAESAALQGADPRTRGEVLLLVSDVHLAEGEADAAEAQASLALSYFRAVCDPSGECRSRVRRAHALMAGQRWDEGAREARRALKAAGERRTDLRGLALLTLGRACLRTNPREAAAAFADALALPLPFSFTQAARIGRALAAGAPSEDPAIAQAIDALESRGDRRFLSYCLAELRDRFPQASGVEPLGAGAVPSDPGLSSLAAAAEALQRPEPVEVRVAGALRALRTQLPWWRAALVGRPGLLFHADREQAVPLRESDLASSLCLRGGGPAVVDLGASESWRRHPDRALHGLAWALLAPVGGGRFLYADVREGTGRPGERELSLLAQVARLLAAHVEEPVETDAEPSGLPGVIGRSPAMEALFTSSWGPRPAKGPCTSSARRAPGRSGSRRRSTRGHVVRRAPGFP